MDGYERGETPEDARSISGNSNSSQYSPGLNRHSYEIIRGGLAKRLCTAIDGNFERRRSWIKDIVPSVGLQEAERIVKSYQSYYWDKKDSTFILAFHPGKTQEDDHLHLYHTCGFNNSTCRCSWLNGVRVKRREPRHITRAGPIESERIENILEYLLKEPRQLVHVQIGPKSECEAVHRLKDIRQTLPNVGIGGEGTMETCEYESESIPTEQRAGPSGVRQNQGITSYIDQGVENISWSGGKSISTSRKLQLNKYLIKHLLRLLCVPIEASCTTTDWMATDELIIYDASNPDYKLAVASLQRLTCNLKYNEIQNLHNMPGCLGIYSARNNNHYFTLEESIQHVEYLLRFQYDENFVPFLKRLYDICEKNIPKKNSMFVQGRGHTEIDFLTFI